MQSRAYQSFFEGRESQAYTIFGALIEEHGVLFRVWAPHAVSISVVGDWNSWNVESHPMHRVEGYPSMWEVHIPEAQIGQRYKYAIVTSGGELVWKLDPYARAVEMPPETASIIAQSTYAWNDHAFMENTERNDSKTAMNIYEMHLGSWKRTLGEMPCFRDITEELIAYLQRLAVTHVEFMPLSHHPFYGSWGYQCLGYFATTPLYGSEDDLRYMIDRLHQAGIACILDWVPAHFPADSHAMYKFDGEAVYEHPDPRKGFHTDWNTAIFDFGRPEVRSFLLSSARYWLEEFHFDGLRVDAVASMLYLNYSRADGEWIPNVDGGHENYDAITLCTSLSEMILSLEGGHLLIAEESTAWPKVSHPISEGGLGFTHKWDMGWMHDILGYLQKDYIYRPYHHRELNFRGMYAFAENYILALSHDEVVYGKGSLYEKMFGDDWQKFAQMRVLFGCMIGQPGKKMIFMGMEFGQKKEWNHDSDLDWYLLQDIGDAYGSQFHRQLLEFYHQLSVFYKTEKALHDDTPTGTIYSHMDAAQECVVAWIRQDIQSQEYLLIVYNYTPNPKRRYRLGVPMIGDWSEVFCSDRQEFGGSGMAYPSDVFVSTNAVWADGFAQSILIDIPPLAVGFWKYKNT